MLIKQYARKGTVSESQNTSIDTMSAMLPVLWSLKQVVL